MTRSIAGRRQDEDLTVADAAGPRDLHDLAHDLVSPRVVDPHRDLDLRQKRQREFTVVVLVEVVLLPTEALDLSHHEGLQRRSLEALQDLLGQERLDNRNDLFQGRSAKEILAKDVHLRLGLHGNIAVHSGHAGQPHGVLVAQVSHARESDRGPAGT